MYAVIVKTSNSEVEYGTTISSTRKLHDFLAAMDFQLVTSLTVQYFRELKSPHDVVSTDTSPTAVVGNTDIVNLVSHGPDSWQIETPATRRKLSPVTESTIK